MTYAKTPRDRFTMPIPLCTLDNVNQKHHVYSSRLISDSEIVSVLTF